MTQRLKVLVIAEAANPEWVSVPLVGWSMAQALRDVADVHLVTQIRNRDAILRAGLIEGRDFTAIDSEALAAPLWRLAQRSGKGVGWTIKTAVSSLGYGYFERLIWRRFGPAIRAGEYDIVHRITPLSPAVNSPLATKCARAGVPFVLGPINGGVPWPEGFRGEQRREREWLSHLRGLYRANPARARMLGAAGAILCGSRIAMAEIPARHRDKTVWLPENAIDPARFNALAQQGGDGPLRACFIGRLVPLKGVDMALAAMTPALRAGRMRFDIIGAGPMEEALRAQVAQDGLGDAVTFHGWLGHGDVQRVAAQSQLLVFPSVREFGGGAVLEAMALGLVPLVLDYAGPGELVDAAVGYKVPMGTRDAVIAGLARQIEAILADPAALVPRAAAARARVAQDFTWAAKARQIAQIWHAVRAGTRPLPQVLPLPGTRDGGGA